MYLIKWPVSVTRSCLHSVSLKEPLRLRTFRAFEEKHSVQTQQTDLLGGRGHVDAPLVSVQSARDFGRGSLVAETPASQEAQLVLGGSVSFFSPKYFLPIFFSYMMNLLLALKALLSGGGGGGSGGGSDTVAAALDLHVVVS